MSAPGEQALHERIEALEREIRLLRRELTGLHRDRTLPDAGSIVLLHCRVGRERAALPLDAVEEVVPLPTLSALPDAPAWVAGLLNLRGRTVPVLDVAARLERAERRRLLGDLIVVCRVAGRSVGLLVQDVFEVSETPVDAIGSPGQIAHAAYVLGVFDSAAGPVLIFSPERLAGHFDEGADAA